MVEEKRRTEKGATHRQPAGGQESDTKREEEKEGEKSCRSNIRGRRRKQDQRPWKKVAEVEERFRVCIVAIFPVDVLPLIYNLSLLSQKRIKQSIPIIIAPSGFWIPVIALSTVPLTFFLDNPLGSLHPREPQFDSLEVQKFSTTEKWKFASRYYSGMQSTIWKCKLYCSGVHKIVWDMSAGVRGSSRHTIFF